ncbi:hypothetical protein AK830_g3103 [Neonectria ditissima]|uniref:Uncharacterized protein n=1 Tax=Neonectria ditissima TaxID=78410 RepID=A0A0P7BIL7_9HYPO|nr:hypothetical protein AK830_g3103 [Neonectria ditissima]
MNVSASALLARGSPLPPSPSAHDHQPLQGPTLPAETLGESQASHWKYDYSDAGLLAKRAVTQNTFPENRITCNAFAPNWGLTNYFASTDPSTMFPPCTTPCRIAHARTATSIGLPTRLDCKAKVVARATTDPDLRRGMWEQVVAECAMLTEARDEQTREEAERREKLAEARKSRKIRREPKSAELVEEGLEEEGVEEGEDDEDGEDGEDDAVSTISRTLQETRLDPFTNLAPFSITPHFIYQIMTPSASSSLVMTKCLSILFDMSGVQEPRESHC